MVIELIDNGSYFSGNLEKLLITQINSSVDIDVKVGDYTAMDREKFYPDSFGQVVLHDFGKLIQSYFSFPDLSNTADFYSIEPLKVLLSCQDKTSTVYRTIYVVYSKAKVSMSTPATGMIYSRYKKNVYTALGREEYIPLYAEENSALKLGVAYLSDNNPKYIMKDISMDNRSGMMACRVSLSRIASLFNLPASNILYYDAMVSDGTKGDKLRYMVDDRSYKNATNFLFLNNFGIPEAITLTGIVEYEPVLEGDILSLLDKDIRANPGIVDVRTVNSGFLSNDKYNALMDMLTSADIRVHGDGALRKVVITDIDFKHRKTGYERFSVTVTYRPAERCYAVFERLGDNTPRIFDKTFDYTFI